MRAPNKISWNQLKKNILEYMFTYSGTWIYMFTYSRTCMCSLIDGHLFEDEWEDDEIYFNFSISNEDSDEPVDVRIRFAEQWKHFNGTDTPIPSDWANTPFIPLVNSSVFFNDEYRGEEFITFYDEVDSRKLI